MLGVLLVLVVSSGFLVGSHAQTPPLPPGGSQGLTWTMPSGWTKETPSSPMRRAQYRIPGPAGLGECRATGHQATLEAQRAAFDRMIRSLGRGQNSS